MSEAERTEGGQESLGRVTLGLEDQETWKRTFSANAFPLPSLSPTPPPHMFSICFYSATLRCPFWGSPSPMRGRPATTEESHSVQKNSLHLSVFWFMLCSVTSFFLALSEFLWSPRLPRNGGERFAAEITFATAHESVGTVCPLFSHTHPVCRVRNQPDTSVGLKPPTSTSPQLCW